MAARRAARHSPCRTPAPRSRWWAAIPDRVRALAKFVGRKPCRASRSEARYFDAVVHATPLGMFPHVERVLLRWQHPRRRGVRHGVQSRWRPSSCGAPANRESGAAGNRHVRGTGCAPIRDLDRRHGARAQAWRRLPRKRSNSRSNMKLTRRELAAALASGAAAAQTESPAPFRAAAFHAPAGTRRRPRNATGMPPRRSPD